MPRTEWCRSEVNSLWLVLNNNEWRVVNIKLEQRVLVLELRTMKIARSLHVLSCERRPSKGDGREI